MGMDLCTADASGSHDLRYNWNGWSYLIDLLNSWGVDTSEFVGFNDGDLISEETCKKVAAALELHLDELSDKDRKWLEPHIEEWRNSGGFRQW